MKTIYYWRTKRHYLVLIILLTLNSCASWYGPGHVDFIKDKMTGTAPLGKIKKIAIIQHENKITKTLENHHKYIFDILKNGGGKELQKQLRKRGIESRIFSMSPQNKRQKNEIEQYSPDAFLILIPESKRLFNYYSYLIKFSLIFSSHKYKFIWESFFTYKSPNRPLGIVDTEENNELIYNNYAKQIIDKLTEKKLIN